MKKKMVKVSLPPEILALGLHQPTEPPDSSTLSAHSQSRRRTTMTVEGTFTLLCQRNALISSIISQVIKKVSLNEVSTHIDEDDFCLLLKSFPESSLPPDLPLSMLPEDDPDQILQKHEFDMRKRQHDDNSFWTGTVRGYLHKTGAKAKGWKKRYFILEGNKMQYFKRRGDKKPAGEVPLYSSSIISDVLDEHVADNAFLRLRTETFAVASDGWSRVYYFSSEFEQEKAFWMSAIRGVIQGQKDTTTLNPATGSLAQQTSSSASASSTTSSSSSSSTAAMAAMLKARSTTSRKYSGSTSVSSIATDDSPESTSPTSSPPGSPHHATLTSQSGSGSASPPPLQLQASGGTLVNTSSMSHLQRLGSGNSLPKNDAPLAPLVIGTHSLFVSSLAAVSREPNSNQIIKEGWLYKTGQDGKGWKKRYFRLFADRVQYFKKQSEQTPSGEVSLMTAKIEEEPPRGKPFCFSIQPLAGGRKYYLAGSDEAERSQWIVAVLQQIKGLELKQETIARTQLTEEFREQQEQELTRLTQLLTLEKEHAVEALRLEYEDKLESEIERLTGDKESELEQLSASHSKELGEVREELSRVSAERDALKDDNARLAAALAQLQASFDTLTQQNLDILKSVSENKTRRPAAVQEPSPSKAQGPGRAAGPVGVPAAGAGAGAGVGAGVGAGAGAVAPASAATKARDERRTRDEEQEKTELDRARAMVRENYQSDMQALRLRKDSMPTNTPTTAQLAPPNAKAQASKPSLKTGTYGVEPNPNIDMNSPRVRLIHELLVTEGSYLQMLEAITELWVVPLRSDAGGKEYGLSAEEKDLLFRNVTRIASVHSKLFSDLRERFALWGADPDTHIIADLFIEFVPFFRIYTEYVNRHDDATELWARLRSARGFEQSKLGQLEARNLANPKSNGQNLSSCLIAPIQRIPRYKLLLQEVVGATVKERSQLEEQRGEHPDLEQLRVALELVKEVALHINESLRSSERRAEMHGILAELGVEPSSSTYKEFVNADGVERSEDEMRRVVEHRYLLGHGYLWKVSPRSSDRKYMFYLFNDALAYASPKRAPSGAHKFNLHRVIPTDERFMIERVEDEGNKTMWRIVNKVKSFLVYTDDEAEKRKWLPLFADYSPGTERLPQSPSMSPVNTAGSNTLTTALNNIPPLTPQANASDSGEGSNANAGPGAGAARAPGSNNNSVKNAKSGVPSSPRNGDHDSAKNVRFAPTNSNSNAAPKQSMKQVAFDDEGEAVAPLWVANKDVSACPLCERKFTFIRRRHHCRTCGQVVCAPCSNARAVLKSSGTEPVRICSRCATERLNREARERVEQTYAQLRATLSVKTGVGTGTLDLSHTASFSRDPSKLGDDPDDSAPATTVEPTDEEGISGIAIYDYDSKDPNDINFKAGDTIQVLSFAVNAGEEWAMGRVAGTNQPPGLFPKTYVRL